MCTESRANGGGGSERCAERGLAQQLSWSSSLAPSPQRCFPVSSRALGALPSPAGAPRSSSEQSLAVQGQQQQWGEYPCPGVPCTHCETALLTLVLGSWIQRELSCACLSALTNGEVAFRCGTPKSTACALAWSSSAWFSCSYSDSGAAQEGPAGAAQGHRARWHLPKRPRQGSAESQLPGCSFCLCNALTSSFVCKWGFLQTSGEEQLTANSSVAKMCVCV